MKKLISILAALAVVTTCSVVGFAADFTIPSDLSTITKYEKVTEGDDAGLYVVPLADVAGSQEQTTILAVKGDTISVGSIEYIGQSADTTFKFDLRNTLAAGETVYVLAGGSDIDAQVVGYMAEVAEEPEVEKITISGTVASGYAGATAPTIVVSNGADEKGVIVNEDGTFSIEVEEGTYVLTATKKGHLSYTKSNISATTNDIVVKVVPGNINGDNVANINDMTLIVANYGLQLSTIDSTDARQDYNINEDDYLNINDMTLIVANYGDTNISE